MIVILVFLYYYWCLIIIIIIISIPIANHHDFKNWYNNEPKKFLVLNFYHFDWLWGVRKSPVSDWISWTNWSDIVFKTMLTTSNNFLKFFFVSSQIFESDVTLLWSHNKDPIVNSPRPPRTMLQWKFGKAKSSIGFYCFNDYIIKWR